MTRFAMILLLALFLAAFGCGANKTPTPAAQPPVSENERAEYEGTAEQRLGDLGARIDSLKANIDSAGTRATAESRDELARLEVERDAAVRKLAELRAAGAERWQTVELETADLLDSLGSKINRMSDRMRGRS